MFDFPEKKMPAINRLIDFPVARPEGVDSCRLSQIKLDMCLVLLQWHVVCPF